MKDPNPSLEGRNFWLESAASCLLILVAVVGSASDSFGRATFCSLLALAAAIPLFVQLRTGYLLHGGVTARGNRREHPVSYWFFTGLWAVVFMAFALMTIGTLVDRFAT